MEFDQSNSNIRHRKNDSVDNNNLRFMIERRMEFTSTRKRMSILVLDPRDHRYKLYVKGADSEIQKRLKAEG
jgi:magnesium-transporting ATPase (P-type)